MFKCGICGKQAGSGEKANMVVIEKRDKVYVNQGIETKGWEIVREQIACLSCFNARQGDKK